VIRSRRRCGPVRPRCIGRQHDFANNATVRARHRSLCSAPQLPDLLRAWDGHRRQLARSGRPARLSEPNPSARSSAARTAWCSAVSAFWHSSDKYGHGSPPHAPEFDKS
jgi:hypothetical protein